MAWRKCDGKSVVEAQEVAQGDDEVMARQVGPQELLRLVHQDTISVSVREAGREASQFRGTIGHPLRRRCAQFLQPFNNGGTSWRMEAEAFHRASWELASQRGR